MNITNNTVLISGGTAGMGLEIAKTLIEKGNKVIITGRDRERLDDAVAQLKDVTGILFDVSKEADVDSLVKRLTNEFPELNVVINNAATVYYYDPTQGENWDKAKEEMDTNFFSVIRLTEKLLPGLLKQDAPAIVNVSSITAIAPGLKLLTYSASKAALHNYTRGLRVAFRDSKVKVFELMPPLVATNFSKEIGGPENGIPASQVADEFIVAFEKDEFEIHVGKTADIYELEKTSYTTAIHAVNGIEA